MAENVEKEKTELDWVTGRYECSLPNIFRQLRKTVKADVATRNSLRPVQPTYEFSVLEEANNFTVVLEGNGVHKSIGFNLAEHAIVVKDDTGFQMFEVSVRFNEKGECKLIASDENRELWRFAGWRLRFCCFAPFRLAW